MELESQSRLLEAQRLKMRTEYDLEMLQEMGFCNGIENYSRHLSGRPPGSKPYTIIDFFPKDLLVVIDESHATIPQIGEGQGTIRISTRRVDDGAGQARQVAVFAPKASPGPVPGERRLEAGNAAGDGDGEVAADAGVPCRLCTSGSPS